MTVVSESHFPLFQAKLFQSPDVDRFRGANGSKVMMKGIANIVLGFSMLNSKTGKSSWKTATLQAMVGNTNHNILSTTALCRSGWQFSQWDGGAELRHSATGDVLSEIIEHSGCPWVRMLPSSSVESSFDEPNMSLRSGLLPFRFRLCHQQLKPNWSSTGVRDISRTIHNAWNAQRGDQCFSIGDVVCNISNVRCKPTSPL